MHIIECNETEHGMAILAIFNHAIVHSTALFDYEPRPPESMKLWFETKRQNKYPVLGAVNDRGDLLGFVSYGPFRAWPAYKYTVEHSVYIHPDYCRCGIGTLLLETIIAHATEKKFHVLIGGIEASNQASIQLHEKHGFVCSGIMKQVGYKFGRWLDLALYQLTLDTPQEPKQG